MREAEYVRGFVMAALCVPLWCFEVPEEAEAQDRHRREELLLIGGQLAVDLCTVLESDLKVRLEQLGNELTVAEVKASLIESYQTLYRPVEYPPIDRAEMERVFRKLTGR